MNAIHRFPLHVLAALVCSLGAAAQSAAAQIDVRTYLPAASAASGYVSYLRVVNTGSAATAVSVALIDGVTGMVGAAGQLTASLPAGGAVTFSALQIETALGSFLAAGDRSRIRVTAANSTLEVQSFMVQPGGVFNEVSSAQSGSSVAVSTYLPAASAPSGYVSYLRVINIGATATPVTVAKIDPATGLTGAAGTLNASLPANAAITYSAAQVETALGAAIAVGERPRIVVTGAGSSLEVQSFLIQPGGAFTNVSNEQSGTSIDVRSYVPAAVPGYTSYLRVINDSASASAISASVMDDVTGLALASGTLIASLPGYAATTLSSAQVETALGLAISAGSRPRIRVSTPSGSINLRTQSLLLQPGGAFNEISNGIGGGLVNVRTFVPSADAASGYNSYLRVINTTASTTPVTVALIDAATGVAGTAKTLIAALPGGAALTFSASQIEATLGTAVAAGVRPRIQVSGAVALDVQSFLTQPGGAFTEMSDGQATPGLDVTPPVTTVAPAVSATNATGTTLAATINETGTGYYLVLPAASTTPTVAGVLAGTAFAMTANTAASKSITGLSGSTSYKIYFVAKDAANNAQNTVQSVAVTTSAAAPSAYSLDNCTTSIAADVPAFYKTYFKCVTVTMSGGDVLIATNSLPPHASYYYGSSSLNYTAFDTSRGSQYHPNPSTLGQVAVTLKIPTTPISRGLTITSSMVDLVAGTNSNEYSGSPQGVSIDSVQLFHGVAAPGDSIDSEAYTFDNYNGHPAGTSYHYHSGSPGALEALKNLGHVTSIVPGSAEVELYGMMCDGTVLMGCTELDGSAPDRTTLDAQNGHTGTIKGKDGVTHFTSRYHVHLCTSKWTTANTRKFTPEIQFYTKCTVTKQ